MIRLEKSKPINIPNTEKKRMTAIIWIIIIRIFSVPRYSWFKVQVIKIAKRNWINPKITPRKKRAIKK